MTGAPASRIVVHLADQRRSRTDSHGIVNFSLGLTRHLPRVLEEHERLLVVVNDEIVEELGDDWRRPGDDVRVLPAPRSTAARLRTDHRAVPAIARHAHADAVLFPKGFLPVAPRALRGRTQVACLHDAIPRMQRRDRSLPARRRLQAAYFEVLTRRTLRRADARLFVSAFSAAELGAVDLGPLDRVIGEGITLPRQPYRPLRERRPQAVLLASPHPHKRTGAGVRLLAGDEGCRHHVRLLVVVGDGPIPPVEGIEVERHRGPLDSETLAALLADSRLLVYPSCYEGFGLPPIEALAMGTPTVFRRNGAAREVLAGVPGGYDAETGGDFAAAASAALNLEDAALRTLRDRMWTRFDWTVTARSVADAVRIATAVRHA